MQGCLQQQSMQTLSKLKSSLQHDTNGTTDTNNTNGSTEVQLLQRSKHAIPMSTDHLHDLISADLLSLVRIFHATQAVQKPATDLCMNKQLLVVEQRF